MKLTWESLKTDKRYYGLAHEMREDDDRLPGWLNQIKERGFDSTEMWNLDLAFVKFILPRLIFFRENVVPDFKDAKQLEKNLNFIIKSFKKRIEDKSCYSDRKISREIEKAYELFGKILPGLWC